MKWKLALIIGLFLLLTTTSIVNAPRALAAANSRPLPVGSWWTARGTYREEASGTGSDKGTWTRTADYTAKFSVTNKGADTITVLLTYDGQWSCKATENWRCEKPSGTWSSTSEYTIALDTLVVTDVGKDATKDLIGHAAWLLVNVGHLTEGGTVQHIWWVPNPDSKGDSPTDVGYNVSTEGANVKGIQMKVWTLAYNGDRLGWRRNGDGVYSRGPATETELYDPVYGIWIGMRYSRTADGVEVGGRGTWTEEYSEDAQFEDTSLDFEVPVTLNVEPGAHVAVTVDGVKYGPDRLPMAFDWAIGTTHALEVDSTVEGDTGVRYVFIEWSDGSKDASRTLTATEEASLTARFKTQYELKVVSDIGDPQGAGWYDAGTEATVSVDSPQPETGLMGSLGATKVFQEWSGDLSSDSRTAKVKMDDPKTVEAKWTTDNSQAYVVLGGIAGVVIVAIAAFFLLSKRRGQPKPRIAPFAPSMLTRPPAAPPPPPTAYPPRPSSQTGIKYCVHCGATIPSVVQYCTKCGRKQ